MTGPELQALARALSHADLVAALVMLCSGMYPRIARDSVIAELERRTVSTPKPAPVPDGRVSLFDEAEAA
jgi:hypothetical protein